MAQRMRPRPQLPVVDPQRHDVPRHLPRLAARFQQGRQPAILTRKIQESDAEPEGDDPAHASANVPEPDPKYKSDLTVRIRSWPFWILIVAIASGPWFGIAGEPQWSRVTWIPFNGFEDRPRDMLVNFLLFVPFGWSFAKSRWGARGILVAAAVAAAISIGVEIPQLFFKLRNPSATDVVMAACGSAAGSLASQAFNGRDPRRPARRRETGETGREQQEPGRG